MLLLLLSPHIFASFDFVLVIMGLVTRFAEAVGMMRHVRMAALGCLGEIAVPVVARMAHEA